jgi:hypothetical protein
MAKQGYFVMDSMEKTLTYGVTVYQVWQDRVIEVVTAYPGACYTSNREYPQELKYETSSKAKANAVCEYLNLKAEQDDLDQYRSDDIKGTIVPGSINC